MTQALTVKVQFEYDNGDGTGYVNPDPPFRIESDADSIPSSETRYFDIGSEQYVELDVANAAVGAVVIVPSVELTDVRLTKAGVAGGSSSSGVTLVAGKPFVIPQKMGTSPDTGGLRLTFDAATAGTLTFIYSAKVP